MRKRKKLSELTLKDDFMFSAVMVNPKNCKPMLERILGINIASVEVDREKSMIYHPEYKGIPMDKWVHFAIEADDCEMFLKNILKENTNININIRLTQIENALQRKKHKHISNTAEAMVNHHLCQSNQALFRAKNQL